MDCAKYIQNRMACGPGYVVGTGISNGSQARPLQSVSGCARLARGKSRSGKENCTDSHYQSPANPNVNTIVIGSVKGNVNVTD